jgi:hypothetical protein
MTHHTQTKHSTQNNINNKGHASHNEHITQIAHHTQTKHSTQNYTNNKGHTTHNETTNIITTTIK